MFKKVSADAVTKATIEILLPFKDCVHTITEDNGREFAGHEQIGAVLDADIYFAHPYSSWERVVNENANGLMRQYVKKGSDLRQVTDVYIQFAQTRGNDRPRKCLGFNQPAVNFKELAMAA